MSTAVDRWSSIIIIIQRPSPLAFIPLIFFVSSSSSSSSSFLFGCVYYICCSCCSCCCCCCSMCNISTIRAALHITAQRRQQPAYVGCRRNELNSLSRRRNIIGMHPTASTLFHALAPPPPPPPPPPPLPERNLSCLLLGSSAQLNTADA